MVSVSTATFLKLSKLHEMTPLLTTKFDKVIENGFWRQSLTMIRDGSAKLAIQAVNKPIETVLSKAKYN